MPQIVSWIHFGDLHISNGEDQNYRDFLSLIEEGNHLQSGISFGLLPGDNADDGEEDQYVLVQEAIGHCRFPVYAIPGDHDVASGGLGPFRQYLSRGLPRSLTLGAVHFVFLNSVYNWPPVFGLGSGQMAWLRKDLAAAREANQLVVVFMHAYPSEHGIEAGEIARLLMESRVLLVEMGHTHYNELAHDGYTVFAATRSIGQVEEGPPGFSIGTIDDGVVSWKFKPLGQSLTAVITSPSDERLIVDRSSPAQLVRGLIEVRARVWGEGVQDVTMSVDGTTSPMQPTGDGCTWRAEFDSRLVSDGSHSLDVTATTSAGTAVTDSVRILVNQPGEYIQPARLPVDHENAFGAWREKHILGTQLGPNENGHHWHSRHHAQRQIK